MCSHIRNGQVRIPLVRGEICNRRWTEFAAQSHDRLAHAALACLSRSLIICIQLRLKLWIAPLLTIDQFPCTKANCCHADDRDEYGKKCIHRLTLVENLLFRSTLCGLFCGLFCEPRSECGICVRIPPSERRKVSGVRTDAS